MVVVRYTYLVFCGMKAAGTGAEVDVAPFVISLTRFHTSSQVCSWVDLVLQSLDSLFVESHSFRDYATTEPFAVHQVNKTGKWP